MYMAVILKSIMAAIQRTWIFGNRLFYIPKHLYIVSKLVSRFYSKSLAIHYRSIFL